MKKEKEPRMIMPYKPWVTVTEAQQLFSVGKDQLMKWRQQGVIMTRARQTAVQMRTIDIDRAMTDDSNGVTPEKYTKYKSMYQLFVTV